MALISAHDHERAEEHRTTHVFVEFRDGCVGRIYATGEVVVNLYIADNGPAVIHGLQVAPDKCLFDVDPDILIPADYIRLLNQPESEADTDQTDRDFQNGFSPG